MLRARSPSPQSRGRPARGLALASLGASKCALVSSTGLKTSFRCTMNLTTQSPTPPPPQSNRNIWTEKMAKWTLFSVLMALIPLGVAAVIQATRGDVPAWVDVVGRGELLLITAALCARSCGELFTSAHSSSVDKIVAGGAAIGVLLFTAIYYADVASAIRSSSKIDHQLVALVSLFMYCCAIVSGARCIHLSESQS